MELKRSSELIAETDDQNEEPPQKKAKNNPFKIKQKDEKERRKIRRSRLIVRNISYKSTEESLKQHFSKFGTVTEVNLLKRGDGKLVGCAFIQFEKVNEAAKAIAKGSGKEFLRRPIFIDWAINKDDYVKKKSGDIKKVEPEESNSGDETKEELLDDVSVKSELDDEDEGNDEENQNEEFNEEVGDEEEEDEDDDETADADDESENHYKDSESESNKDSNRKYDKKLKMKPDPDADIKVKKASNDVTEGCTIFLKNVPFSASDEDVFKCCKTYGPLYYAIINKDPVTGYSKGTAFVKFKKKESADMLLQSVKELTLMGAVLEAHPALSRSEIENQNKAKKEQHIDSRNLYLVKEGLIMAGSKAADGVSASDMAKRHKLEQVKTQILKNLTRFVSRNRLSIHNLPLNYDDERLRRMVIKCTNFKPHECRVMREKRPSVGFPNGKSKGFGFVSFKTHENALTALRKLNNNPNVFSSSNRPIVSFSIEDKSVHKVKEKRLQKSRENNPTYKVKMEKRKQQRASKNSKTVNDNKLVKNYSKMHDKKPIANGKNNEGGIGDFVGMESKPGTFVRMRSSWKINDQASKHNKKVSNLKRKERKHKEKMMHRLEKQQVDRPKKGKKMERDDLPSLINKYKKLISSSTDDATQPKRTKWYTD